MAEISKAKETIQKGKGHVVQVREGAKEASGTLNNAKGNLAGAAEAVLEAVKRLKLVETDLKSAAGQTQGVLSNLDEARANFEAAGASSSPFEAIRLMPGDLKGCHDWLKPTADVLGNQEQLAHVIGLMSTIHEDITHDGLVRGLEVTLEMFGRIANQVAPTMEGRADSWDAML